MSGWWSTAGHCLATLHNPPCVHPYRWTSNKNTFTMWSKNILRPQQNIREQLQSSTDDQFGHCTLDKNHPEILHERSERFATIVHAITRGICHSPRRLERVAGSSNYKTPLKLPNLDFVSVIVHIVNGRDCTGHHQRRMPMTQHNWGTDLRRKGKDPIWGLMVWNFMLSTPSCPDMSISGQYLKCPTMILIFIFSLCGFAIWGNADVKIQHDAFHSCRMYSHARLKGANGVIFAK